MIRSNGFSPVLYRLWPICMTARHLEVIIRRRRTRFIWLWPCGMQLKKGNFLDVNSVLYINGALYIYIVFILLAHLICLWLAMIVYSVHVSR